MKLFGWRKRNPLRELVRDRELLAARSPGGSQQRPIEVVSASVVEVRARALACPQCEGPFRVLEHRAPASGLRQVAVRCELCGVARDLWFRLVSRDPN